MRGMSGSFGACIAWRARDVAAHEPSGGKRGILTKIAGEDWLERFAPLHDLEGALRDEFAALPARAVPAGAELFAPGAPCRGFALVLEGEVRVDVVGASGRTMMLYRVGAGQTCVQTTLCLLGGSTYSAHGVAERDLALVMVPPALFDRAMAQASSFRRFVFASFAARLDEMTRLLETVAFVKIEARLAAALLGRARRQGPSFELTHVELAEEIGTAREVVSRQIEAFRRQGLVAGARGRIEILDQNGLEALATVT
jgi:CRP/FNR family transcriptional regulator